MGRDMGPILAELKQLRKERDKYRQEAIQERELTVDIVGERDQLIIENERMKDAIKSAHLSLTWSNTENQVPHAIWHLEQVLNLRNASETTE